MKKPEPIQILDAILDYLRKNDGKEDKDSLDGIVIVLADIKNHIQKTFNYSLDHEEIMRPIRKLLIDNFIEQISNNFYLSYEGYLFIGYAKQIRIENALSSRKNIRDFVLSWGTALAGSYGLFEILKWIFHHFHWKLPF